MVGDNTLDESIPAGLIGNILDEGNGAAAGAGNLIGHALRTVAIDIGYHNGSALFGKPLTAGFANASPTTCYQCYFLT